MCRTSEPNIEAIAEELKHLLLKPGSEQPRLQCKRVSCLMRRMVVPRCHSKVGIFAKYQDLQLFREAQLEVWLTLENQSGC